MPKKIGVTASRNGLTAAQKATAARLVAGALELHHGDCVGGDADIHAIMRDTDSETRIVTHPPTDEKLRAFCAADETRKPFPYLERNLNIVNETDLLIGFPATNMEIRRSGTWSTIRYAARNEKPLLIVWPDGSTDSRLKTSRNQREKVRNP